MVIKKIELNNFRNYTDEIITFSPKLNIIYGNNAQGKTNILEGIYTLLLTKSHRLNANNNLIKLGETYTKIVGIFDSNLIDTTLKLVIDENGKHLEKNNSNIRKISDYISSSNIIIFYPEDLNLIKGSPLDRRKYLNIELSQLYKNYIVILNDYNKLLKIRNDLLKKLKIGLNVDLSYFNILTNYLIDRILKINEIRKEYFNNLNNYAPNIFEKISGYKGYKISYKPNINLETKEELLQEFKKIYNDEINAGVTLIGPHKDDYEFYLGQNNLKDIGSQGQQRMGVLAMKLSEIKILENIKNDKPILLLDDVFSELDDNKKNMFLNYIKEGMQVIITTTDLKNINKNIIKQAKLIEIENGKLKSIVEEENGRKN